APDVRPDLDRRPRRQQGAAESARHRNGLSELRPVSAHDGAAEPRLRYEGAPGAEGRVETARRRGRRASRPDVVPRTEACGALGWAASARRAGSRAAPAAEGLLDGRTALEPRRRTPCPDAVRARPAARTLR